MYLRKVCPLLRINPRNLVRREDLSRLQQVCLRTQNPSLNCCRHLSVTVGPTKHVKFQRCFSTASTLAEDQSSTVDPEITVQGNGVAKPCRDFHDTDLEEFLVQELFKLGFKKPTTIQSYCLPVALSGRDVVGIGQTGSGKTLAYLLPALVQAINHGRGRQGTSPTVLVLAPTRELAQQIYEVLRKFQFVCEFRSVCLFGGVSKGPQLSQLQEGVSVCVATPGRLIDLIEMGAMELSQVSYLVLDEADRMLDMGFEPQIRRIVDNIRHQHQTLMWSATWPHEVKALARDFLNDPIQITVGSTELMANPNIKQTIHICDQMEKLDKLEELLEDILSENRSKVLIFAETKLQVDLLTRKLVWKKIPTSSIHGDRSQLQRDKALYDYRNGRTSVLIATDVAARGLDITDITHVINYDFPRVTDTYVHRIGRTARAERKGTAHSFFTEDSKNQAQELVDVLRKCKQTVNPELLEMAQSARPQRRSSLSFFNEEYNRDKGNFPRKPSYDQRKNFGRNRSQNRVDNYYERKQFGSFSE